MMFGHLSLAVESLPFFFLGLVLLVCGSGLLKPNVSTILGELYRDMPEKRDSGYNLFYMGINIGAFFGPLSASYLRHHYSWRLAFASAGLGMVFSLAIFVTGLKKTRIEPRTRSEEKAEQVSESESKERVGALMVIFGIAVFFWVAFYQYSYTITLWVRDNTRTSVSPEATQSIDALYIIAFTPLLVLLWAYLNKRGKEPRTPAKMLLGMAATAAAFATMFLAAKSGGDHGRVSLAWTFVFYAFLAFAEICVSPMGLSLVSRVAPPGKRGMLMGAWFVTLGLGGYLSGPVGKLWFDLPHSTFFGIVACGALVAAVLLLLTAKRLNRVIDKTV